jgi:energy-coupling factor transporter ATP-binding protein EcfA2
MRLAPLNAAQSETNARNNLVAHVHDVLDDLQMGSFADTAVSAMSGGQKRKLSVAIQLLSDRKFLFLDEPTSGLDASTAKDLLHVLRRAASRGGNRTVIITIHQPRVEVWNLFDQVVVLGDGRLCYQGIPDAAVSYLVHLFFKDDVVQKCMEDGCTNPADALLDLLHDHGHQVIAAAAFSKARLNQHRLQQLSVWAVDRLQHEVPPPALATTSWSNACALEWSGFNVEYRRLARALGWSSRQALATTVVLALLMGLFWFQVATPLGYLVGSLGVLLGPWTLVFAPIGSALSSHKIVVMHDVEDNVMKLRHFLIAAGLYVISLGSACSLAMVGIVLPLMGSVSKQQFLSSLSIQLLSYTVPEMVMLVSLSFKRSTGLSVSQQAIFTNSFLCVRALFIYLFIFRISFQIKLC